MMHSFHARRRPNRPRQLANELGFPEVMGTFLTLALWILVPAVAWGQTPKKSAWRDVNIPEAWKTGAGGAYVRGTFELWYRCGVHIPTSWQGRELSVFVEGADDARAVYVNERLVGKLGEFPPHFRSGLGTARRFSIPADAIRYGADNWLSIRVLHREGRSGFNVAAPVIFAGADAIRLAGQWQLREGGELDWKAGDPIDQSIRFAESIPSAVAEKTLRKLDDDGPQPPAETLKRTTVADDLALEVVLAEPDIAQPLAIRFDARGRLWVLEYRQYPDPAGLKPVSRDKFLRTVYDRVPQPPPHHVRGRDRISIHEDSDNDGHFDKHSIFVDGLNIATSFAIGRGGVWVLNPPYLLFYPDRNGDDVPDGDPVVHLEGFGLEDTHSVANSLCFGPDGWLYAAQGSTVSGHVRRPGSKDEPVHSMGQLIWRFHPEEHRYEIFAEGGGNAFGVEIDAQGRLFSGHNGGNTRGFHYVQGGYYQKGFAKHGSLSNPYAFGYFPFMPHEAVPRFTHALIVYDAAHLPSRYRQTLFGVAPLQSEVVVSERRPIGSTFSTRDITRAFHSQDTWVRPVGIALGPDGAVYVADFYEQRIDHAAHFQGRIDRTNGRVYRIRSRQGDRLPPFPGDLQASRTEQLLSLLEHPNRTIRRIVQRILGDRKDGSAIALIKQRLANAKGQAALELTWALHHCGGLDDKATIQLFSHADPYVRLWAVRLAADDRTVTPEVAAAIERLCRIEPHIEVRNQLACSVRRLPAKQAMPMWVALAAHDEDQRDPYQPLCLWWALEEKVSEAPSVVLSYWADRSLWNRSIVRETILNRLMRRFAQAGTRQDLLHAARLLNLAPTREHKQLLMNGFEAAWEGRSLTALPDALVQAISQAGGLSLPLRVRQGDEAALAEALAVVTKKGTPPAEAIRLVEILGQTAAPQARPTLVQLATADDAAPVIRRAALGALESFNDPAVASAVIAALPRLDGELREAALALLVSRPAWTLELLQRVDRHTVASEQIPERYLKRALLHRDERIDRLVHKHWGQLAGATTEQMYQQIERYRKLILSADGNPYAGKQVFDQTCAKCHRLFDEGGDIGPDLTPFQRQDLSRVLLNVVNPNAEIREGFETFLVRTDDGRTLSGFVEDQDNQVVVLKDAEGRRHPLERSRVEEMIMLKTSVMPEKLLDSLTEEQVRDLFAYLRSSQPLP